ncbi:MAG: CPBP family intramembrane glutamic endopeptidase [Actinomycetota bacterium]
MGRDLLNTGREHAWSWPLEDWDQMWRPRMWLKKPPRPHKTHFWHIAAIIVIATYANIISNLILDEVWHIPFQLGILGVAVLIATRAGTTRTSMGLRRDRARRGFIVGGVIIGLITVGFLIVIAAAAVFPDLRTMFDNTEVIEGTTGWVLFQAFVRIPIATALYEEVLFRGVIFGMFARRHSPLLAAVLTSLLFGLWHIAPTIVDPPNAQLDPNGLLDIVKLAALAVAGTAPAGLAFLWTRLYANSVWASVLAHIGTNSIGMLAALFVVKVM